jgi:type IV secretory pathway component VirB8
MDEIDTESIKAAVDDGSYYAAARTWYSELFHTPIAERSYYVIVIFLAIVNGYFAINSFMEVFPISPRIPFVTYTNDIWEDLPYIKRIASDQSEDKNVAVMKFLLGSYVENRESYDLRLYELRYRNIWSQSTAGVFEQYKTQMDASNSSSFYRLYTNKEKRVINVLSTNYTRTPGISEAHVIFDAAIVSLADSQQVRHSKWRADITYKYTDFEVDQSLDKDVWVAHVLGLTGKAAGDSGERRKMVPMTFMVSNYQVKELLE